MVKGNKKIAILIFNPFAVAELGGLEKQLEGLLLGLSRKFKFYVICDHQYSYLFPKKELRAVTFLPVKNILNKTGENNLSLGPIFDFSRCLLNVLSQENIQIAHIMKPIGYFPYNFLTYLFSLIKGKTTITSFHGYTGNPQKSFNNLTFLRRFTRFLEKKIEKTSYRVAISKAIAEEATKYFGKPKMFRTDLLDKKIPVCKGTIISHSFVDEKMFNPLVYSKRSSRELLIQKWPSLIKSKAKIWITYPARILPLKGQLDLIMIAKILKLKKINQTVFLAVGPVLDKEYYYQLNQIIKRNRLEDEIFVFDGIPRKDMPYLYASSDLIVHLSRSEGLSNSIIEAQAMGIPVVAYNVGGIKEALEHNVTGYLIPQNSPKKIAQKIIFLLKNPNKICKMKEKAKDFAQKRFNKDSFLARWEAIYTHFSNTPRIF